MMVYITSKVQSESLLKVAVLQQCFNVWHLASTSNRKACRQHQKQISLHRMTEDNGLSVKDTTRATTMSPGRKHL